MHIMADSIGTGEYEDTRIKQTVFKTLSFATHTSVISSRGYTSTCHFKYQS